MMKMAILVDGGFYRVRARQKFGFSRRTPNENADILEAYCRKHAASAAAQNRELYRIFYYDCPPVSAIVTNPITGIKVDLSKSSTYSRITAFLRLFSAKRKVAIRRGKLGVGYVRYSIKPQVQDELFAGTKAMTGLTSDDIRLEIGQKGVDMRLGLDLVEMALKRLVDKVVLVSDDSDFVPAIKMARREGVDVILDPMGNHVSDDLMEHVDGVESFVGDPAFIAILPPIPAPANVPQST